MCKMSNALRERQSNIELLRILSMFGVLVLHANFFALGSPSGQALEAQPLEAGTRVLLEFLGIGAVNTFVLISGWFGIRPRVKGFAAFAFQCLFFSVGVYAVSLALGHAALSVDGVMKSLYIFSPAWFVTAYAGLYLLSPLLNLFLEKASERQVRLLLFAFFAWQTLYGWVNFPGFFAYGYSTLSFIGLYLLARYCRLHRPRPATLPRLCDLALFLFSVVGGAAAYCAFVVLGEKETADSFLIYTSPLMVFGALFLLLFFSKLELHSGRVNWVAASCFAVYLLHCDPNLRPLYVEHVRSLFNAYDGWQCLGALALFLACVFLAAVVIDRVRLFVWQRLSARMWPLG